MPIYEYQCDRCGQILEVIQKFDDPAPEECSCGAKHSLHKLISHSSFKLTGTGWYVTDFRDKGKPLPDSSALSSPKSNGNGANGDNGKSTESPAKSEKKESKPAPSAPEKSSGSRAAASKH